MKLHLITAVACALLAAAARPQDAARLDRAATRGAAEVTDFADVSPDELPAVRRVVDDEALHRDRMGRIRRLRELAIVSGDRTRLAQLDELERRQIQLRDARRVRTRASLSDDTWRRTQDFLARGGVLRARKADQQVMRERLANQQAQRERAASAGAPQRQASRPSAPRGSSGSTGGRSGGRSPR